MSSHPSGLRFSPFSHPTSSQKAQQQTKAGNINPDGLILRPGATAMSASGSGGGVPDGSPVVSARNPIFGNNSNRSSMDVSTCSYNTLIIHNDDNSMYASGGADYGGNSSTSKKERPRSFGTGNEQVIKEILETPDYNQNSVLKQLVKEMKLPSNNHQLEREDLSRPPPKYNHASTEDKKKKNTVHDVDEQLLEEDDEDGEEEDDDDDEESADQTLSKLKSKSQPDLSRIIDIDLETIEALMKDNMLLKEQLNHCYKKVAKTKKLEEEVANIYRVHEELVQSCERREKLERAARQRLQELNRVLKEEVDVYQSQLLAPSEHQLVIAQLFQQNKELTAAKERQDIELAAQRATLQEQRKHIGILDKALQNAQHNSRCLEEELRKKQTYAISQLPSHSSDVLKDSNRSGSSTNSMEAKWIADQTSQLMSRMDIDSSKLEQRRLDEVAYRQNLAKSIEKTSQESQRMLDEARQEKMRYLEECHSAQKKVCDLQNHLKDLEGHVVEKDALIRALQIPKGCGSSFDSWPLNASNASFNTSMDQNYGPSNHMSSSSSSLLPDNSANYPVYMRSGDVGANFLSGKLVNNSPSASPLLLAAHHHRPSYSPKPSSTGGYENRALMAEPVNYNALLDSQERAQLGLMTRKSMEDHLIKKEYDAQLKVSAVGASNHIILAQIQTSREIAKSCRDMATTNENETFY